MCRLVVVGGGVPVVHQRQVDHDPVGEPLQLEAPVEPPLGVLVAEHDHRQRGEEEHAPGQGAEQDRDRDHQDGAEGGAQPVEGPVRVVDGAGPAGRSDAGRRDGPRPAPAARDPQPREPGHPPVLRQALTVADGVVAGPHRSWCEPGWSGEHHAAGGEVPSHEPSDPGAGDGEGTMRRSRPPRHAPRPGTLTSCWPGRGSPPAITPIVR